jgi:putative acetyltransferase
MSALSDSDMNVRLERPEDVSRIWHINERAFEDTTEANLVDALRAAGAVTLSMVVELGGEVVAHALVSPVVVSTKDGEVPLVALGPVAVLPQQQHQGIGTHLIDSCLEQLRAYDHAGVVVVGEPGYYQRFGFIPAGRWGLRWDAPVPDENFMALELSAGRLAGVSGVVRYRPEFTAD